MGENTTNYSRNRYEQADGSYADSMGNPVSRQPNRSGNYFEDHRNNEENLIGEFEEKMRNLQKKFREILADEKKMRKNAVSARIDEKRSILAGMSRRNTILGGKNKGLVDVTKDTSAVGR